jgi:hypothetical protein
MRAWHFDDADFAERIARQKKRVLIRPRRKRQSGAAQRKCQSCPAQNGASAAPPRSGVSPAKPSSVRTRDNLVSPRNDDRDPATATYLPLTTASDAAVSAILLMMSL